jgi:hypothetical protein
MKTHYYISTSPASQYMNKIPDAYEMGTEWAMKGTAIFLAVVAGISILGRVINYED